MLPFVSIPFIAGQWSLPPFNLVLPLEPILFQSPSLRGSGRFNLTPRRLSRASGTFQSPSLRGSGRFPPPHGGGARRTTTFQSPSLRGSGRFMLNAPRRMAEGQVSIPFIAGQWSLRKEDHHMEVVIIAFQSPSLRGSGRFANDPDLNGVRLAVSIPFIAGQWSLPSGWTTSGRARAGVSIPFIAGQWSLPTGRGSVRPRTRAFQSPSLRGSGRFIKRR